MMILFNILIIMVVEENQQDDMEPNEEIEKQKPKPFRYITDINEINEELTDTISKRTVMVDEQATSKNSEIILKTLLVLEISILLNKC